MPSILGLVQLGLSSIISVMVKCKSGAVSTAYTCAHMALIGELGCEDFIRNRVKSGATHEASLMEMWPKTSWPS